MTKADGSATASGGDLIATFAESSKEHQVVMIAGTDGHIRGSKPLYFYMIPNQVHVATASNPAWDMWNADGTLRVRVVSILQIPDIVTAVTGVSTSWLLERTSAVGTGGTAQTAWLPYTGQTALSANITCRSKPTGGATAGTDLRSYILSSEETNAGTIMIASQGGLELVPAILRDPNNASPGIVLGPSEGIRVTQVTSSSAGNSAWLVAFTVE